ncbi:hypothetical protein [Desulfopila sp. IMCC35008]|uniref:hypothetical protein n=1 Tax=Desulfopila sp. IMCC35008 TaxID=2653858 RepID=UPI0013D11FD3|nr:hypothetical protein [Desulfopila sp. IMCC35008]
MIALFLFLMPVARRDGQRETDAPKMLKMFEGTPAKVLLIHNDMTLEQRHEIGNEREQMSHWIGTATTDEERGTYRMMEELYRQLGPREPQVAGITGVRGTPVSLERAQGVNDYMELSGKGQQLQLAFSNWGAADAESKANVMFLIMALVYKHETPVKKTR